MYEAFDKKKKKLLPIRKLNAGVQKFNVYNETTKSIAGGSSSRTIISQSASSGMMSDSSASGKRPKLTYYNQDQPEALVYEDFMRIDF
jgi:hypothetical protein